METSCGVTRLNKKLPSNQINIPNMDGLFVININIILKLAAQNILVMYQIVNTGIGMVSLVLSWHVWCFQSTNIDLSSSKRCVRNMSNNHQYPAHAALLARQYSIISLLFIIVDITIMICNGFWAYESQIFTISAHLGIPVMGGPRLQV